MWSATEEKSNPLSSREDVTCAVNAILRALDRQFPAGQAQFSRQYLCALQRGYCLYGRAFPGVVGAISADGWRGKCRLPKSTFRR
jgi:hypothetical protein